MVLLPSAIFPAPPPWAFNATDLAAVAARAVVVIKKKMKRLLTFKSGRIASCDSAFAASSTSFSKMRAAVLIVALVALASVVSAAYFKETFDNSWSSRWVVSDWKKSEGTAGLWKHTAGPFYGDAEADKGSRCLCLAFLILGRKGNFFLEFIFVKLFYDSLLDMNRPPNF